MYQWVGNSNIYSNTLLQCISPPFVQPDFSIIKGFGDRSREIIESMGKLEKGAHKIYGSNRRGKRNGGHYKN
jgi:hypothetical protein